MNTLHKYLLIGLVTLLSNVGFAQKEKKIKVLFVVTSHDQLGDTGKKTGLWIEEFATPYYYLTDLGIRVDIVSPKGGLPPIDPKSTAPDFQTEASKRYFKDEKTQKKFSHTRKLAHVNQSDYDAVFYPGGHGPLWDLAENKHSIQLIESFYAHNKPIAFVCHAPAALKNVKAANGQALVKGKNVTGFTNGEEAAVGLTQIVPFLIENMLSERGAIYQKGADWSSFAITDGWLITGQNPQSSALVAKQLLNLIKSK